MPGDYTLAAAVAPVAVVALELAVLRTGLLARPRYWATMAIVFAFQVPVDGWLTKAGAPIVIYSPHAISGVRAPWDIPVEDFGFGFALVTLTLLLWERLGQQHREEHGERHGERRSTRHREEHRERHGAQEAERG